MPWRRCPSAPTRTMRGKQLTRPAFQMACQTQVLFLLRIVTPTLSAVCPLWQVGPLEMCWLRVPQCTPLGVSVSLHFYCDATSSGFTIWFLVHSATDPPASVHVEMPYFKGGSLDVFLLKFSEAGKALDWDTMLGLAVDAAQA